MPKNSCTCPSTAGRRAKAEGLPFLLGILVAILPKCPFCILAYSSAITLCSGAQIRQHTTGWSSWISIALTLVILGILWYNFRGRRTWFAALLVVIGGGLILHAELFSGSHEVYYAGATLLLAGVWVNASFYFFYRSWLLPFWKFLISKTKVG